jgi:peptidoglycan/xylan/chitin deacetylase (PgdA/CDA1 family)
VRQTLRNLARWGMAVGAGGVGIPARHARERRGTGRWGIILRYHRVIPAKEPRSYYRIGISEEHFARQMDWLARNRNVVSLDEMLRWRESGRAPDEDLVALTFDDGYLDNLTHAAPVLARLKLPAIFYVSAACLQERMPFWPEVLASAIRMTSARSLALRDGPAGHGEPLMATAAGRGEPMMAIHAGDSALRELSLAGEVERKRSCLALIQRLRKLPAQRIEAAVARTLQELDVSRDAALSETPPVMKAEHLRALAEMGFALGSHSVSHPFLPSETPEAQKRELTDSRRILAEAAGVSILDFCYPGGGFDATTLALVREAGYRSATTTESGILGREHDCYRLPRLGVGEALASGPRGGFSGALMDAEISGWFLHALRRGRKAARPD